MNVLESKYEILRLLAEQLGIHNRTTALLGLLASRLDPTGEDVELKNAFDELSKSNVLFEDRLTISVKNIVAEVSREQT